MKAIKPSAITYTSLLVRPIIGNFVVLNYWSPGYNLPKKETVSNKEVTRKIFHSTSTFEAALAHLKNIYGGKEYLKFKDDAHPGHVSVRTAHKYLSIGTQDAMEEIGLMTEHKICFSTNLLEDVISFKRKPELMLDLHTLNSEKVDAAIEEFKSSQKVYGLLGSRLGFSQAESCATSAYISLVAGGFEELLPNLTQKMMARTSVLTPGALSEYVKIAREYEQLTYPEAGGLAQKFSLEMDSINLILDAELNRFQREMDKVRTSTEPSNPSNKPEDNNDSNGFSNKRLF